MFRVQGRILPFVLSSALLVACSHTAPLSGAPPLPDRVVTLVDDADSCERVGSYEPSDRSCTFDEFLVDLNERLELRESGALHGVHFREDLLIERGGDLYIGIPVTVDSLFYNQGTVEVDGELVLQDDVIGGTNAGVITIDAGGTLVTPPMGLDNAGGIITVDASGILTVADSSTLHNHHDVDAGTLGTIEVEDGGTLVNNGAFVNEGVFRLACGGTFHRGDYGGAEPERPAGCIPPSLP